MDGGTTVTVTGTGLSSNSVSFGGTNGTIVAILSDNAILVAAQSVSTAGAVDVTVTTPNNTSAANSSDTFTFEDSGPRRQQRDWRDDQHGRRQRIDANRQRFHLRRRCAPSANPAAP